MRRNLPCILGVALATLSLSDLRAAASWDNWNCNLRAHWGAPGGSPNDTGDFLGVTPAAADGYDAVDSKKPGDPFGNYVYAWFERPAWGQGPIMGDWRAPVPEGDSKTWGTEPALPFLPPTDYWGVRTNLNAGTDACPDPCGFGSLYPLAASVYVSWEFGVSDLPPLPLPPEDYEFTLKYKGGLAAKPEGCAEVGVSVPAMNATWDMEATPYVVLPIWSDQFQPFTAACDDFAPADAAKFVIIVTNPDTQPTCAVAVLPDSAQKAPATFVFTGLALEDAPFTYSWDFGDGTADAGSPVTHTYDVAGSYTIACTVTDANGDTADCATQVTVLVNEPPTCDITFAPADPVTGDTISFDSHAGDPDGAVASVTWQFGDGAAGSGTVVGHQYTAAGEYTVTAVVTDNTGATGACTAVSVVARPNQPPVCSITYVPADPMTADLVTFDSHAADSDGMIVLVAWAFGDGATASGATVGHTYATADTYIVTATVTDNSGATGTCSAQVEIGNRPPACGITYSPTEPTTADRISFNSHATDVDGTVSGVAWDFGDGCTGSGATITHKYLTARSYTVTATATDDGGATGTCAAVVGMDGRAVTTRVSVASNGTQGNDICWMASISADGRYVAFDSNASNLVPGDTNARRDVFVHDRQTEQTIRVSVASGGAQGNSYSQFPSISAGGRYVAFYSSANNLIPNDRNSYKNDVFVRDVQAGLTSVVSVASDGSQTDYPWENEAPSVSADGRCVSFVSSADSLVPGDTNERADVFVRDRQAGQTSRVSVASDGSQGNENSGALYVQPTSAISADGRYVAFESEASNLVPGDTNSRNDIFVHDRQTGLTARVSVASDGSQSDLDSWHPSISADGRYVAFHSPAANLVPGDTNGKNDVFVHDCQTGQTTRVSVSSSGGQANNDSYGSSISGNGRCVAFDSNASNLVQRDSNGTEDVFVHDLQTGQTTLVSLSTSGSQGSNRSYGATISGDGRQVAFVSYASNLVPGDTNGELDVFVRDLGNVGPACGITFMPPSPQVGQPVTFEGHAGDADGEIVGYAWDFGDGSSGTGMNASHVYAAKAWYTVSLTVTDDQGETGSCEVAVLVAIPPVCTFTWAPTDPVAGESVTFDGTGSSDPDGTILGWQWDFGAYQGTGYGAVSNHTYTQAGTYVVSLTLTDNDAATMSCSQSVQVATGAELEWACWLKPYCGAIGGLPMDTEAYFGVVEGATDGYDLGIDQRKPSEPFGPYVYAWFSRPTWSQGFMVSDYRSTIAEGTSKVWGTGTSDTYKVKVSLPQPDSGVRDSCGFPYHYAYPMATAVYLTWQLGVGPGYMPPDDYQFTLRYLGGINSKPAGTAPPGITVPAVNQTWDMRASSSIVFPLWHNTFSGPTPDCQGVETPDLAKFKIIVENPAPNLPPTCAVSYAPSSPTIDDSIAFASGAADPDGAVVSAHWDFGDGTAETGEPVAHAYADPGNYTVCVTVTDDQGGQTTCCTQVTVTYSCQCDLAVDRTHCRMPAAGHLGQRKTGQIGARNLSYTEYCDVVMRVTDNAGNVVFESDPTTIGPGRRIRLRFDHCYTADEIGSNLWTWEVWPLGCGERTPWNNVQQRKVIVHP